MRILEKSEIEIISGAGAPSYADAALAIGKGAATGAALGRFLGPWGTVVGSAAGAGIAASKVLPVTPPPAYPAGGPTGIGSWGYSHDRRMPELPQPSDRQP